MTATIHHLVIEKSLPKRQEIPGLALSLHMIPGIMVCLGYGFAEWINSL